MTGNGRARENGEGSIFPYRNGFAAYVWVVTLDGKRKRKWVYGKDREIVHGKWVKLHQEAKRGPVPTRVPTLVVFLSHWLEDVVRPNLAPLTYATYESLVRLYIIPGVGGRRIDRLRVEEVQRWLNGLRTACQCCAQGKDAKRPVKKRRCCALENVKCCRQVPSAQTIKDIRTVLRAALAQAVKEELVSKNVAVLVTLPKARRSRKTQAWGSDEARVFLESARDARDPLYAAYVLIVVLGLRKGEVLGLRWEDVDFDKGELSIALQLQRVRRKLLHRETKTDDSECVLPLPAICLAALKIRRVRQGEDRAAAGGVWRDHGLVFTTRFGTPIEPRNFNRSFDGRVAKAGVRRITVHDARRTCASLLADLDVHPRVAMRILRHANFNVTMEVYTKISSRQTRDALNRLGESLGD